MSEINLPFRKQFELPMLNGQKVCTTRTKIYGKVGDEFLAFGASFEFVAICSSVAMWVGNYLYKEEGFEQPGEFHKLWEKLHPRLRRDAIVFVHFFKRLSG